MALQSLLMKRGYHPGRMDGEFEDPSIKALQQWLTDSGYPCSCDGRFTDATKNSLGRLLQSGQNCATKAPGDAVSATGMILGPVGVTATGVPTAANNAGQAVDEVQFGLHQFLLKR